jgi:hypothetical protein
MTFKSDFLRVLESRGFIHQISDPEGLDKRVLEGPLTAYIGFDCTAPSLHVGLDAADHDALLAAADRQQADHLDGRRHHQGGRPVRQG